MIYDQNKEKFKLMWSRYYLLTCLFINKFLKPYKQYNNLLFKVSRINCDLKYTMFFAIFTDTNGFSQPVLTNLECLENQY